LLALTATLRLALEGPDAAERWLAGEVAFALARLSCRGRPFPGGCPMIARILVLGGGSAGFLVAIAVKYRLPQLRVTVLRSKDIGIIGVGEGTALPVINHLHGYLRLDPAEFHRIAQPTWKLGIRFLWGPRSYFDYVLNRQFDLRFPGLPKVPGYYCDDVPDFGFISALMTHNRAFPRRPDGLPQITQ
jgi:tryptophan 7-halogenase